MGNVNSDNGKKRVKTSQNEKPIRILLSGLGLIGAQHARMVHEREDCELAAIVVPVKDKYKQIAAEYGAQIYSRVDDALSEENIDAAIISSPNEFHFAQALTCIENGVPVLVEKPLTDRISDAKLLIEKAAANTVPVLVGHHRTYSPLLSTAQEFLNSKKFGNMVVVQGSALFYKPPEYFAAGPWRTKPGGGPILLNLIHEIGILRHLCGEIKKVSAFESRNTRGFDVEDTVTINFEFISGVLGNFLLSDVAASNKSWEMTSGENPAYPHYPSDACYHFAGTNGSLDFPNMHARFYPDPSKASWWGEFKDEEIQFTPKNPLECQLSHFIDVVRGGVEPLVSVQDGYRNMLVIEAIKQSIVKQTSIEVDAVLN